MAKAAVYRCWGVEFVDFDGDRRVAGIGYSRHLSGAEANFDTAAVTTLMFRTRSQARAAIERYKMVNQWAFTGKSCREGGNRIYRSVHVVRLTVTVSVGRAA